MFHRDIDQNGEAFSVFRKISNGPAVAVHGQVFTRPHIVDLILDLAGYTPDKPLHGMTLLEPGSGNGAFLVTAAKRLLSSRPPQETLESLSPCILGIEQDDALVEQTRLTLVEVLIAHGIGRTTAKGLAQAWVIRADFLNDQLERQFDFIVGNPPYVRQEAIPKPLLEKYRERFSCFYDRADLYVAFFERGLELLSESGTLAFICPNRFTRNNYGRKLRQKIVQEFRLTHVVDLPEASPFEQDVMSYPGIYVLQRGETKAVNHVLMKDASPEECEQARRVLKAQDTGLLGNVVYHHYTSWFAGEGQWASHSPDHLALLRKLEAEGVALGSAESGCKVGIGVASGADDVFIVGKEDVEIEQELLLPLVTTKDIESGELRWRGKYLINPFLQDGSGRVIVLGDYPKARQYFESHRERLSKRNIAKRKPIDWYRTIDLVHPGLTNKPMVLIPDIKASNTTITLKQGAYYPHHNLYFITSEYWELRVIQAIMRSDIARFFIFMYGVKMRQGYYRFQAQYLRRICIPLLLSVPNSLASDLSVAMEYQDSDKLSSLIAKLYRLSRRDVMLLRSFDKSSQTGNSHEAG